MKKLLLISSIILTGCADVLPTDPSPEYSACFTSAADRYEICNGLIEYQVKAGIISKNLVITYCNDKYNQEFEACNGKF
jgi:ABC-type branched-subunit amino acid transport system substrate-binding protein